MKYQDFLHDLKNYLKPYGWIYKYGVYDIVNDNYKIDFYKISALKNNKRIDAYIYLKAAYLEEYTKEELEEAIYLELSKKELEAIKG